MIDKDAMEKGREKPDHGEIMKRFDAAMTADRGNREDAADDLRFVAGDQWLDAVRRQREAQGRPVLTINRMPQFIRQVTGDMRQSRPSIKFAPVDDKGDVEVAKIYNGLTRQIERQSRADMAYTLAFQGAVSCGIGHFRITTEYAPDAVTEQDIFIRAIQSSLAVVWDPNAKEVDRSDARYCFVVEGMSRDAYKERWPDAGESSVADGDLSHSALFWQTQDEVRVAEYWYRRPVKRTLAQTADGQVLDLTEIRKELHQFLDIVARREVDSFDVEMVMVSGDAVLEGPYRFPVPHIPIIPVIGEETIVGTRVIRSGLIRHAKDPQRLYNIWRSSAAESIGLAPKAPYLVTPAMIKSFEGLWNRAGEAPLPYLIYNPDQTAPGGKPERIAQPQPPSAMWQEAKIAADDMQATTGIYDASLGARSNETSGKAILARQREGDTSTYHFFDNLTHAIQRAGTIIGALIPKIYDTERVVRLLNEDGSEAWARVNQRVIDGADGRPVIINDLTVGKYDVTAISGPSYTTQRIEAANAMIEFMRVFPAAGPVMADMIAEMMDWPRADELAQRLQALLPPQVQAAIQQAKEGGGEGQMPPQQEQQPDPKAMLAAEKVAADIQQVKARTQGAQLDNAAKMMSLGLSPMAPADPTQQPA